MYCQEVEEPYLGHRLVQMKKKTPLGVYEGRRRGWVSLYVDGMLNGHEKRLVPDFPRDKSKKQEFSLPFFALP